MKKVKKAKYDVEETISNLMKAWDTKCACMCIHILLHLIETAQFKMWQRT